MRRRDCPWLALACYILLSSATFGQVDVVTTTTIFCRTPVPAGAKVSYDWYADQGLTLTPVGNGSAANPSGPDGTYDGVVVATVNGQKMPFAFSVTIGDTPEPPQPSETLRNWVGKQSAAALAKHYRTLPEVLDLVSTPQNFGKVERDWRQIAALPDAAKVYAEIDRRLNAALAVEPWKESLAAELLAIAADLEPLDKPPVVEPDEPSVEPPAEPTTPIDEPSTPIEHDGFRVLFIEEGTTREPWFDILTSTSDVLAYLNSHAEGGNKGWRKWDQHESGENAPAPLRDLAKIPRPGINCVVLTKDKRAYVYQLTRDTTDEELMALLKKYGGE